MNVKVELMCPKDFVKLRHSIHTIIHDWHAYIDSVYATVYNTPIPASIRPATAADIVVGAIIWYPDRTNDLDAANWQEVVEVLKPRDDWKGYVNHTGSRYGLYHAFVEVENDNA